MARNAPVITSTMTQYYTSTTTSSTTNIVDDIPNPLSNRISYSDPTSIQYNFHHSRLTVHDVSKEFLADTVASILTQFCSSNVQQEPIFPDPRDPAALFFSPYKQKSFTLSFYCRRLLEFNCCSKSCYPVAILYLMRLAEKQPIFELNDYNVHRLICTALVLAAKYLDDVSYSNSHYAKVGGIQTCDEMNKLELHMLKMLDFRVYVSNQNYEQVENQILQIAASRM